MKRLRGWRAIPRRERYSASRAVGQDTLRGTLVRIPLAGTWTLHVWIENWRSRQRTLHTGQGEDLEALAAQGRELLDQYESRLRLGWRPDGQHWVLP